MDWHKPALHTIHNRWELFSGPLLFRQGLVEALSVSSVADGTHEITIGGEIGELPRFLVEDVRSVALRRLEALPLAEEVAQLEFTGLTRLENRWLLSQADDHRIYDWEAAAFVTTCESLLVKKGRHINELRISGIAYDPDSPQLWLVSENYPSLLMLDMAKPKPCIERVYGIGAGTPSDVAIHDRKAWVTFDHNYFDARPGVVAFELE